MLRFSGTETEDDDKAVSEEQRFYYLRLMAKPSSGKNEPIKTKFVRWSQPSPQQESLETNHDLEVCYNVPIHSHEQLIILKHIYHRNT